MNFTGNRLLDLLGPKEFARLEPHLTAEALRPNQILQNREKIIDSVYFPTNGMVSIVTVMREGKSVEVGITGREGMVGIPVVLGDDIAANEAVVQFPGHGLRMPANVLQQEVLASQQLRAVLLRFVQAFLNSATQSAACNRAHLLEQRLARWLLTARDRTGGHYLPFTHELIATMLGVRRAGVTVAAQSLQSAGLIRYSHGHITIEDRTSLEAFACECYAVTKRGYERLLGFSGETETAEALEYVR